MLKFTEVAFALRIEDVPDATAMTLLDQHVTVYERLTKTLRDDAPNRSLASTHKADEHRHHCLTALLACPG